MLNKLFLVFVCAVGSSAILSQHGSTLSHHGKELPKRDLSTTDVPHTLLGPSSNPMFDPMNPPMNTSELLALQDNFVVVYLSNAGSSADLGVAGQVDFAINLISNFHLNGDGPKYFKVHVTDAANTVEVVQELYDAGVRLFVGPETSSQARALADWAESPDDPKNDVAFFTHFATNPTLGARPSIIQMIPSDEYLVQVLLDMHLFLPENRKCISVIYDDGVYATGIMTAIRENAPDLFAMECSVPAGNATMEQATTCVRQVASGCPPRETMVIILVQGADLVTLMKAAYAVYGNELGYSGNSDGEIVWIGGDSVAFDVNIFQNTDDQPDIWLGAQIVNLNAVVPAAGTLRSENELTVKWWNDIASFLDGYNGGSGMPSTDISPIILFALDIVALLFLNAGKALTGAGIVDQDSFRRSILTQTPFLTAYSGNVRLDGFLQRSPTAYVATGIVKTPTRPSLNSGIWVTKSVLTLSASSERFELMSSGMRGIVPPMHLPQISKRQFKAGGSSQGSDSSILDPNDPSYGSNGLTGNGPMDFNNGFPRRLRARENGPFLNITLTQSKRRNLEATNTSVTGYHNFLVHSIVGDGRLAFQSSAFKSNVCHRHIERTRTLSELLEVNPQASIPVCQLSQTGFVLSVIDEHGTAKHPEPMRVSDVIFCDQKELLSIAVETAWGQTLSDGTYDTTRTMTCAESQPIFAQTVGMRAMWDSTTRCGPIEDSSLGDAYYRVDPSIFVTRGPVKPLLNIPGLVREYVHSEEVTLESAREILDAIDGASSSSSTHNLNNNVLDELLDLRDPQYVTQVRGEDWFCSCGGAGVEVTCLQMYRLMECPRHAAHVTDTNNDIMTTQATESLDLEKDCCLLPQSRVSCERSDPLLCANAILQYMDQRDVLLERRQTQIALDPRSAFLEWLWPLPVNASNIEDDGSEFVASRFILYECRNFDIDVEDNPFESDPPSKNGNDTSPSSGSARKATMFDRCGVLAIEALLASFMWGILVFRD